MSVIRIQRHERNFTIIDNGALRDERLSFRARGVLAWCLSMPDGWRISREELARCGTEGERAMRSALKELTEAGYLVRENRHSGGKLRCETVLYEVPPDHSDGTLQPSTLQPSTPRTSNRKTVSKDVTNKPNGLLAAQKLIAFFVDESRAQNKPSLVAKKGQIASRIKRLIDAGVGEPMIEAGIREVVRRNRPEALENVIAENSGGNGRSGNIAAIEEGFRRMGVRLS